MLTPGVQLISSVLLNLGLLVASILILHRYASHLLPKWLFIAGFSFALFLFACGKTLYTKYTHRREAKAMGARLVPKDHGRLPGNLDRILEMMKYWHRGYPGAYIFLT